VTQSWNIVSYAAAGCRRDRGFTLIETIIALAIASILIIVIVNTMISSRMQVEHNLTTLDFLSKATILLEYVKRDIRNATRKANSVNPGGDTLSILITDREGKETEVRYKFFEDKRYVGRKVGWGKAKWFGREGRMGFITNFEVKAVEGNDYHGFYQVSVSFLSTLHANKQKQRGVAEPKPKAIHTFRALVNRRTPDSVDDKWNAGFRER